jgi:hypothetical protein
LAEKLPRHQLRAGMGPAREGGTGGCGWPVGIPGGSWPWERHLCSFASCDRVHDPGSLVLAQPVGGFPAVRVRTSHALLQLRFLRL